MGVNGVRYSGWIAAAVGAVVLTAAPRVSADAAATDHRPVVVVLESSVGGIDPAAVRAAVARELGAEALALDAAPPAGARGVFVASIGADGRVVVVFRDASGRETTRAVAAPARDPRATVATIALLAGNLARDQVDDVIADELRASMPPAPSAPVVVPAARGRGSVAPRPRAAAVGREPDPRVRVSTTASMEAVAARRFHNGALDVAAWTTAGVALAALGGGVAFQALSEATQNKLEMAANNRDPVTQLPLVPWENVRDLETDRQTYKTLAIGLFVTGGVFAAASVVCFAVPRRARAARPRVDVGLGPASLTLRGTF